MYTPTSSLWDKCCVWISYGWHIYHCNCAKLVVRIQNPCMRTNKKQNLHKPSAPKNFHDISNEMIIFQKYTMNVKNTQFQNDVISKIKKTLNIRAVHSTILWIKYWNKYVENQSNVESQMRTLPRDNVKYKLLYISVDLLYLMINIVEDHHQFGIPQHNFWEGEIFGKDLHKKLHVFTCDWIIFLSIKNYFVECRKCCEKNCV